MSLPTIPEGPTALDDEAAARRVLALCDEGTVQDRHEQAVALVMGQARHRTIPPERVRTLAYALERVARLDDPTLRGADIREWTVAVLRSKP